MVYSRYLKYLLNIFLFSGFLYSVDSLCSEQSSFEEKQGIILFNEDETPIEFVYLPNLKKDINSLRSCLEQTESSALQDFVQALSEGYELIPKEQASQAIEDVLLALKDSAAAQDQEVRNDCLLYKELIQHPANILTVLPREVLRSNNVFCTDRVKQCLQLERLVVIGDAFIGGNLTVRRDILAQGNLTVLGNETIQGNLLVRGSENVLGTLSTENLLVRNNATVEGDFTVFGDEIINGEVIFNGNQTINGNLQVNGTITSTGNITTAGDIFADDIFASGDITAAGNFLASDNSYTFTSDLGSGMHHPALSTLTFTTGNITRLEINPAGTVTIPAPVSCPDGPSALVLSSGSDVNPTLVVTQTCAGDAVQITGDVTINGDLTVTGTEFISAPQFLAGNGTETAPSYSFSADTNTGMYRPGEDTLGFTTGGMQRMTINSAGTVTINPAASASSLIVSGNSAASTQIVTNSSVGTALEVANTGSGNALVATGTVNINTTGGATTNIGNAADGGAVNIEAGAASHFITSMGTLTFNSNGGIVINTLAGAGPTTIGSSTSAIFLPGLQPDAVSPGRALMVDGFDTVKTITFTNMNTGNTLAWRDANGNLQVETPIANFDAATKAYVDAVASGFNVLAPVRVVATTPIVLAGSQVIDGVLVIAGDRVLAAGQGGAPGTPHVDNGVWVVQAGAWTRPTDYACGDTSAGDSVLVEEGTTYAGTTWTAVTPAPNDIVCTDPIAWTQFSSATSVTGNNVGTGTGQVFRDKIGNVLNFRTLDDTLDPHLTIATTGDVVTFQTDATSANTPNTIVARDGTGGFSAGAVSVMTLTSTGNITSTVGDITATSGNVSGENIFATAGDVTATGNMVAGGNITSGGQFFAANGTAAAPSYSFTSDTNTGIYHPAADTIGISTGGIERVEINDGGAVTILTPTTGSALTATGNAGAPTVQITGNSTTTAPALRLIGNPTGTTSDFILTIDGSGNVRQSSSTVTNQFVINGGQPGPVTVGTTDATPLNFITDNINRMNINASGDVTINAPTSGTALTVNGATDATAEVINAGAGQTALVVNGSATAAFGETVTLNGAGTALSVTNSGVGTALSVTGTTSLTGTTNINTTGTANTTIGNTSGGTVTITPATFSLPNITLTPTSVGDALYLADPAGTTVLKEKFTSANEGNTIVARDAAGGFSAGAITATSVTATGVTDSVSATRFFAGDGSAAAPSYSFTSDPNTGIYHTATADTIGISTNGLERVTFNSGGGQTINAPTAGTASVALIVTGATDATATTITGGTAQPVLTVSGSTTAANGSAVSMTNSTTGTTLNVINTGTAGIPDTSGTALNVQANGSATAAVISGTSTGVSLSVINSGSGVALNADARPGTGSAAVINGNATSDAVIIGSTDIPAQRALLIQAAATTTSNGGAAVTISNAGSGTTLSVNNSSTGSALTATGNASAATAILTGNSTITAPALRLIGNPVSESTDSYLTIDALGNVRQGQTSYVYAFTTATVISTVAYSAIALETPGPILGWTQPTSTTFICPKTGAYLISYTAQVERTTNATPNATFAVRQNGTTILSGSVTQTDLTTNDDTRKIAHVFLASLTAGDSLEYVWQAISTTGQIIDGTDNLGNASTSASLTIHQLQQ